MRKSLGLLVFAMTMPFLMGNENCTSERVEQMNRNQETYEITHSVERDNINRRLKLANDPTQIMWIYCLSDTGVPVTFSPVVGKVTSSTKRLEPSATSSGSSTRGYVGKEQYYTHEIMGADGTYGSSDPYVYWFTPEGQYFQWSGKYIVSNAPIKLEKPILSIRDIDHEELQRANRASQALKAGQQVNNNLEIIK